MELVCEKDGSGSPQQGGTTQRGLLADSLTRRGSPKN